ncbi:hypothetical protein AIZ14_26100, partial [Salmonella enterica subsp. enterica serovar Typhimurium]
NTRRTRGALLAAEGLLDSYRFVVRRNSGLLYFFFDVVELLVNFRRVNVKVNDQSTECRFLHSGRLIINLQPSPSAYR